MKFNKSKDGDGITPQLRANMLEDGFAEETWVGKKLNIIQPYNPTEKKASCVLLEKVASRLSELIIPLYSVLVRPHLKDNIQFLYPPPLLQDRHIHTGASPPSSYQDGQEDRVHDVRSW